MPEIALSYSRWSTYDQCPNKFNLQYNLKAFPDDSNNPAFIRGNEKHGEAENYVLWRNRKLVGVDEPKPFLSVEVARTMGIIDRLYDHGFKFRAEQKLAIDKNHQATGWFDRNWTKCCEKCKPCRNQQTHLG